MEEGRPAAAGARRGHRRRRRHLSIANRCSSTDTSPRSPARFPAPAHRSWSTSPPADAVAFVREAQPATGSPPPSRRITCCYNRNHMLVGGIRPTLLLPAGAEATHAPAGSCCAPRPAPGTRKFFLGTDSAPHTTASKETELRLRRASTARTRPLELYAEVFERLDALARCSRALLLPFRSRTSIGLPRNDDTSDAAPGIPGTVPAAIAPGSRNRSPRCAPAETIAWRVEARRA